MKNNNTLSQSIKLQSGTKYLARSKQSIYSKLYRLFQIQFTSVTFVLYKKLFAIQKEICLVWRAETLQQSHLLHDYYEIINRSIQIIFNFAKSIPMDSYKVKFKKNLVKHVNFVV